MAVKAPAMDKNACFVQKYLLIPEKLTKTNEIKVLNISVCEGGGKPMPDSENTAESSERICPRCQTKNLTVARSCSKCSLDFQILDYMMGCFTGYYPVSSSDTVILKPGEVAHYHSCVRLLGLKTTKVTNRNYIGTRLSLGSLPIYLGKSMPETFTQKGLVYLGDGELVVTNRRVIVVGSENNYSVKLNDIMDIEFFSDAVQIFHEGKMGGTVYAVEEAWRLWILLYTKLKIEPNDLLLPSRDVNQLPGDLPQTVLGMFEKIERSIKAARNRQLRETFLESAPAVFAWLTLVPPVGFVALYLNSTLGFFAKVFFVFWGLYFLAQWSKAFGIG